MTDELEVGPKKYQCQRPLRVFKQQKKKGLKENIEAQNSRDEIEPPISQTILNNCFINADQPHSCVDE